MYFPFALESAVAMFRLPYSASQVVVKMHLNFCRLHQHRGFSPVAGDSPGAWETVQNGLQIRWLPNSQRESDGANEIRYRKLHQILVVSGFSF